MKTYYDILGVKQDATLEDINKAYNDKLIKSETVQTAYKTLIVADDRKKYDQQLKSLEAKTYYDILGVPKNATEDQILQKYTNLPEQSRKSEEMVEAFEVLSNPRKRAKYNIKLGMVALHKTAKTELKTDINDILNSQDNYYDSYSREIYIRKYESKIDLLKSQIEFMHNERDKDRVSYRVRLSSLMTELEKAQLELDKWEYGRQSKFKRYKHKKDGTIVEVDVKGKGTEGTFVSSILKTSIEKIEENEIEKTNKENNLKKKTGIILKDVWWKTVKKISSGSIKLFASSWSNIQDIVVTRPSLIKNVQAVFMSENDFDKKIEEAIRTR